ncbi:MAG: hypothetical protein EXQ56_11390 [Acidobacteria bacterium]|nr:hypothetical protein [Acidobacteriota bacterium]
MTQIGTAQSVAPPVAEPTKRVYRAGEHPDPASARSVATALGQGKHVVVRLYNRKTYRGHIEAIDEMQFSIRLDRNNIFVKHDIVEIAYLEQSLNQYAKRAIIVGVAVGVAVLIVVKWLPTGG